MNPETPQSPSGAMLQYLSQQPHEAKEILRLVETYQAVWKERRKDSAVASGDAEIIQLLRHRLSELARDAKDDVEQSMQKLELLRRNVEKGTKNRLAAFEEKIQTLRKGIQSLDGLLKPTKAKDKATAKAAKGSKRSAAAKRKPKAAAVAKKKKANNARRKSAKTPAPQSAGTPPVGAAGQGATNAEES